MLNYTWLRFGFALVQLLLEPVRTKHSTANAPTGAAALHLKSLSLEYSSHQRVLLPALRSFNILNGNKVLPYCLINLIVCESAPVPSAFHSVQKGELCLLHCLYPLWYPRFCSAALGKMPFPSVWGFLPLSSPIELLTGRRNLILLGIKNVRNFFFLYM